VLLRTVAQGRAEGLDAEAALRAAVLDYAAAVRAVEPPPDGRSDGPGS
jgi:hypothetical protein